ncbi:ubiquitin carboxyl-terminal hydrolase family protein [Wolffia australiana]
MIRGGARGHGGHLQIRRRWKTTSAQYMAARPRDAAFEKLMDGYKNLLKVTAVQDLILASPDQTLAASFLASASQKLRLNRGAPHFIRRFPGIFSLSGGGVRLTEAAAEISRQESLSNTGDLARDRLIKLLCMSPSRTVPLRAVFKIWRELGLPDDFEDCVISKNPNFFSVENNPREANTHLIRLVGETPSLVPAVDLWRKEKNRSNGSESESESEIRSAFKQEYPPGMKLKKNFRIKVKEWQRLPYPGPYENWGKKLGVKQMEKRAVGIAHEFLNLTVEKMVEVEKISQFRKWFCIDLNIRDLFLDHPGIFYISAKGRRHTVFLREGYSRGRLVNPNPTYEARRKLLHLVLLGKRGGSSSQEEDEGCRHGITESQRRRLEIAKLN